jgi:hypothetical protein
MTSRETDQAIQERKERICRLLDELKELSEEVYGSGVSAWITRLPGGAVEMSSVSSPIRVMRWSDGNKEAIGYSTDETVMGELEALGYQRSNINGKEL